MRGLTEKRQFSRFDVLPNVDGSIFSDTKCHDEIILIHEIKTGSYRKTVEKTPHFWP